MLLLLDAFGKFLTFVQAHVRLAFEQFWQMELSAGSPKHYS